MTAAAAVAAADPTGALIQYGALGILAALGVLAVRVLFTQLNANATREQARADRLEEELRKANADLQDKVLPVLAAAQQVMTSAMDVIRDERRSG